MKCVQAGISLSCHKHSTPKKKMQIHFKHSSIYVPTHSQSAWRLLIFLTGARPELKPVGDARERGQKYPPEYLPPYMLEVSVSNLSLHPRITLTCSEDFLNPSCACSPRTLAWLVFSTIHHQLITKEPLPWSCSIPAPW
jgi:hypothetical protein